MDSDDRRGLGMMWCRVLLYFFLTFSGDGGVVDGLEKRADDVNPLQQVVQQQSVVIQQQAAELTALQTALNELRAELRTELRARTEKAVSFTVHSSKTVVTAVDNGIFVFDVAVSNIGNGYDTQTGIFTAPFSGNYFFLLSIMIPDYNNFTQVAVEKFQTLLAVTYGNSFNGDALDSAVCHVTVHLTSGERVWVRHNAGLPKLFGDRWTTFSGTLVHAD